MRRLGISGIVFLCFLQPVPLMADDYSRSGPTLRIGSARDPKLHNSHSTQMGSIFQQVGRWGWGHCLAVDVKGDRAYVGNGSAFQILDISDRINPSILGEFTISSEINDLKVNDSVAYLCSFYGLTTLDISDPQAITQLGTLDMYFAQKSVLSDSILFVLSGYSQVNIIDISNPISPFIRSTAGARDGSSLSKRNNHIYISCFELPSLYIYDVSNPDSAFSAGHLSLEQRAPNHDIDDTLLVLTSKEYVRVYMVKDSTAPRLLGSAHVPNSSFLSAVQLDGSSAYVALDNTGVIRFDLSNPSNPVETARSADLGYPLLFGSSIAVSNGEIFATFTTGLMMGRLVEPDSFQIDAFVKTSDDVINADIQGNYAYCASLTTGIWVLDITDLSKPRSVTHVALSGGAFNITVRNEVAYVISHTGSALHVMDISNPENPLVRSSYPIRLPAEMAMEGNILYITQPRRFDADTVVIALDISDPSGLMLRGGFVGRIDAVGSDGKGGIAVNREITYVASHAEELLTIDWKDKSSPQDISSFRTNGRIVGIALIDTLVFVDNIDSIIILDSSNPHSLEITAVTSRRCSPTSIDFETDLALVDDVLVWQGKWKTGAIDVSDPMFPYEIGCERIGLGLNAESGRIASGAPVSGVIFSRIDESQANLAQEGWNPCFRTWPGTK